MGLIAKTHQLYCIDEKTVYAEGIGNYFSWYLEYEYGEWELSTVYGRRQGTFKTIGQALRSIDYENGIHSRLHSFFRIN